MKCTLRKVEQGVVATIDERPYKNEFYYDLQFKAVTELLYYNNHSDYQKIIASTIGIGKEIVIDLHKDVKLLTQLDEPNAFKTQLELLEYTKEYDYTETDTQIIIQL